MRIAALLILLSLRLVCHAQEENWRTIPSVTDWIEEINNWPDSVYRQNKIEVRIDPVKDRHIAWQTMDVFDSILASSVKRTHITKHIVVYDIRFRWADLGSFNPIVIGNLHFEKPFEMYYLENSRFAFFNSVFDDIYQPRLMKTRFFLNHYHCKFKRINLNNPVAPTPIGFFNCQIESELHISAIDDTPSLRLENCDIPYLEVQNKVSSIYIDSCRFLIGVNLVRLNIETAIDIYNSELGSISIQGTELPSSNTYIPFSNLENKLALYWSSEVGDALNEFKKNPKTLDLDSMLSLFYWGRSDEELLRKEAFDQLIASYYKLLNIYKIRGESDSYNTAYIEMRNKMTARSLLLYERDPTFNRYFDYQINRFTRVFSDYGTRPAKAIVIFFQVVLAFSIFYFFFPSSWNTTNSRKLMGRLSYLGSYFKSNEGLSDLFEKETKDQYRDYEEFKSFMSTSEKELPVYFKWLSKPLYNASTSRFNLTRSVLKRTDILDGKWADLPAGRKATTSFLIGIYLFVYLIWVLIIRCLNAITLSLNAFSTLGFGEIPTRGLARYVTIVQGFVGWFLLSIFLVSLIGQILN
ncbi:hypothetical protein SAMN05421640_0461 [Ekhidna lutea]|uniref:Ion channel n=1 Tax=Ekhidna lutea TaxID=447679 RepID=A0A239F319_EKHLU|nr:potassium channel family protein [Ekhidna lutea]SNS51217.1 hypothetical protein SAMN05421640_0461 [Ekhidna lutea]